jgi:uncharacterized protein (TIGR04255 family)
LDIRIVGGEFATEALIVKASPDRDREPGGWRISRRPRQICSLPSSAGSSGRGAMAKTTENPDQAASRRKSLSLCGRVERIACADGTIPSGWRTGYPQRVEVVRKMAGRRRKGGSAQLPAAPLTEVIFELRWNLQPAPVVPVGLYDPLLIPTMKRFTAAMEKVGFPHKVDLVHPLVTGPYGVVRRFYRNPESPYPMMQIGSGIFATNETAKYEWKSFRAQVLDGVKALLSSYPTEFGLPLTPNYLELRYVDVFTKDIIRDKSFFDFANNGTSVTVALPGFFNNSRMFWSDPVGRLFYQRALRGKKDSLFAFDMGSAVNEQSKEEVIQLVSKVSSTGRGVPTLKKSATFINEMRKWLDLAHGITSPFFKSFIRPDIMKKFARRGS